MASEVDICNTALSHLGSDAQISSINPPDGSREAGYCKRFYPLARKEMIEQHNWSFALKRQTLAEVTNDSKAWIYAYALPADCLKPVRVLTFQLYCTIFEQPDSYPAPVYAAFDDSLSAPYTIEDGVLYCNEPEAVLLYKRDVVDTSRFTPMFVNALSYMLASYIAGPIIRGKDGSSTAQGLRELARSIGSQAAISNSNMQSSTAGHTAGHLTAR